jgi:voltage-gated potassium channel
MLFPAKRRILPFLDEELLGALRCMLALLIVTAIGRAGFMLIERDWSLWKALFFTLITITTVGYGDQGLSSNGEVFAAMMILLGIGTATYSLSSLVQIAVTYQASWKRRMQRHISRLEDHFIISGYGRIGQTVA